MGPDIQKYKGKPGVWAIRGITEQDSEIKYEYLNVASAADMGSEIEDDLSLMSNDFQNEPQSKEYISKWNEVLTEYVDYRYETRRVAVWKAISEYINQNCKGCFDIVLVAEESDKGERDKIEQDFAFYSKAKFWSDRRRYSGTEDEIESRRKEYVESNKLEEFYVEVIYSSRFKDMQKYFEINKDKQNIRCKLYSDKNESIKKVVLYGHGFAGHKDNKAAEKFAERVLTKYKGIALITFNLPSHGDDVKKKIVLDDCMNYIDIVLDYIRTTLNVAEIYSYATSFGGYLVLRYIKERGNPFKKIVLRSPAINIYESMVSTILGSDELEKIQKGKIVSVGFDRKVQIDQKFLDDLKSADIRNDDYLEFAEDILILHGTKDELVSFDVSRDFAENNIIEFVPVEDADHRFQNPVHMEKAIKKILEFYDF